MQVFCVVTVLFNSMEFVAFLPIVVLIYYLTPKKVRFIWLLAASYFFYGNWEAKYCLLLLATTAITYACAMAIDYFYGSEKYTETKKSLFAKVILAIAVISNLTILAYYKYVDFLIDNINMVMRKIGSTGQIDLMNVILPVGISFFTFQAIGYTIDVYRKDIEPERNFLRYALFVSFFPQLVAGPIERAGNLIHQLREPKDFTAERLREGLFLMLFGYWQKIVIADNISDIIQPIFADYSEFKGVHIALATGLFCMQLYCDFAGYSNIARGSAKLLGIDLMNNFEAPFLAPTVSEFWRRWHISLTSWFRDYVYIPLGGNRKGKIRKYINTLTIFFLSGLWHGASWNYVAWGTENGLLISLEGIFKITKRTAKGKVEKFLCRVRTFILVSFTMLFFRAESFGHAVNLIKHSIKNPGFRELFQNQLVMRVFFSEQILFTLAVAIVLLFCFDSIQYRTRNLVGYVMTQRTYVRWGIYFILILMILFLGAYGNEYEQTRFIYFQF